MAKNMDEVEKLLVELGCTGKRVTRELIESRIEDVDYQTVVIAGQKMMFCGIKLAGGFVQVGKPSVCIDPDNWRDEVGRKVSYDNAFDELWKLEAYHMTYQVGGNHVDRMKAEAGELAERIKKGQSFIDSNPDISAEKLELLTRQLDSMMSTFITLTTRIELE